jgi:hypothetical protein
MLCQESLRHRLLARRVGSRITCDCRVNYCQEIQVIYYTILYIHYYIHDHVVADMTCGGVGPEKAHGGKWEGAKGDGWRAPLGGKKPWACITWEVDVLTGLNAHRVQS